MAKKLYEEASVQDIAVAIREKTGGAEMYKVEQMGNAVRGIAGAVKVEWHQCPEAVRNYLASVTYDPSDYSTSQIASYAPATAVASNYRPIGKTLGGKTYYNQVPGIETPFASGGKAGTLKPLDFLRYIQTNTWNCRDLGGWACDGGAVKYGLLFRGGEPSSADYSVLVKDLGIKYDLNLRGSSEAPWTKSPLGDDVYFVKAEACNWYSLTNTEAWRINLRCVFDAVTHGQPVYFHCAAGADRTGTLACVLEGLLGMSQSDIDKDYELTTFYSGADTDANARRRNESEWKGLISAINAKSGSTFRDKCVTFAAELGFTAAEINAYRKAMIDGTPATVTADISTYTVTKTLTDVTIDNSAVSAKQYQPYTAKIAPGSGKTIGNVKVTMGGADITASAFKGTTDVLRRSITQNLTQCAGSNARGYVIDGQSYVTTLTANTGYAVNSVTILMGGLDVSTYYKDGIISIPEVTGDIVITATAVTQTPAYTNLLDTAIDMNGNVIGHTPMHSNMRYNSSSGDPVANTGTYITGLIPIKKGDVVRIRWGGNRNTDYQALKFFKSDRTQIAAGYLPLASLAKGRAGPIINVDAANGIADFTYNTDNYAFANASYIAIVLYDTLEDVIVTTNEEIV